MNRMDENPYISPRDTQEAAPPPTPDPVAGELLWMLSLTILVGAAAGLFLGPFVGLSASDSRGTSVSIGLGGGLGLLLHFVLRWLRRQA